MSDMVMTERAQRVFRRLRDKYVALGIWDELYEPMAEMTAVIVDRALTFEEIGMDASIERHNARELMARFCAIPENRKHLGLVDSDGCDLDLKRLAE